MDRLFYVNEEKDCAGCSRYLFNQDADEWEETKSRLSVGDHTIVDGTEMVYVGSGEYRDLGEYEEELWDGSIPEETMIEKIPQSTYHFPETRHEDHFVSNREPLAALGHW